MEFFEARNFVCVSPNDYKELKTFAIDMADKLEQCEDRADTAKKLGF